MKKICTLLLSILLSTAFLLESYPALPADAEEITYVLNTNTKKFHRPDCSSVSSMKSKNRYDSTQSYEEITAAGYVPCKNCKPQPLSGNASATSTRSTSAVSTRSTSAVSTRSASTASTRSTAKASVSAASQQNTGITYVLNTNTKKFHLPGCSSVSAMKQKNRSDTSMSYEEVIRQGYEPCKKCNPR